MTVVPEDFQTTPTGFTDVAATVADVVTVYDIVLDVTPVTTNVPLNGAPMPSTLITFPTIMLCVAVVRIVAVVADCDFWSTEN